MRLIALLLALLSLAGCYDPSAGYYTEDDTDMAKRYPTVADDRMQRVVPRTAQVIPRTGPWSGDNQLGYLAKYGPDDRGQQTILKLDEWGPPEIWTVSLFLKGEFQSYNGFRVEAEIGFGAGGSTQVINMDWVDGAQISLPLNAVNVIAKFKNVDVTTEGRGIQLGAQLSRGSRGGTTPPTLMIAENVNLAGAEIASAVFAIPNFTKNLVLVPTSFAAAEIAAFYSSTTQLVSLSGNDIGTITTGIAFGNHSDGSVIRLPVVGSARLCRVFNRIGGAGADINFSLYAELDG